MPKKLLRIGSEKIPLHTANTIIIGAGAAGMSCAVHLVRQWQAAGIKDASQRLLVVTAGLGLGASRMSGSDKQTYYKMGTSPHVPDRAADVAATLTAFGCCHGDNALVEAVGSLPAFHNLVAAGVPFPRDPEGAFVGYKTDNDPYERATSAGPRTSRYMTECLQAEAERLGVRVLDKHVVVEFVTDGEGADRHIIAMACLDTSRARRDGLGLAAFVAETWVLAAGGPGEIYRNTVYPRGQAGIHGAALKAGLAAENLTESQYGLAAVKFRWNVSGSYMQVIPHIFSTDEAGQDEQTFLAEYFDDMPTLATRVFLKGYQWPFDAQRITGQQSSLIDMAVHQETAVRGRRVWMDFRRNPRGPAGWETFRIESLGQEARQYLRKTGAMQAAPLARLAHMNQPAIDIFAENGIDLGREPLQIALCAQHMNGGFAVDKWWQSTIPGTFVIGEMAGTHGVKRPGGAALNAGQVGAMRAAEYIAHVRGHKLPGASGPAVRRCLQALVEQLRPILKGTDGPTPPEAMNDVRKRMTRFGAHLRSRAGTVTALRAARELYADLLEKGLKISGPRQLPAAVQALQQCLTHLAVLKAISGLLDRGAGSRGSHCVLDDSGIEMHPSLIDPATERPYRFQEENESLREEILRLTYNPDAEGLFDVHAVPPRPAPRREEAFETAWARFREGGLYGA